MTISSDRNWFPVPAFFIAADFDTPDVDRSALPAMTVLANLQSELHTTNRMLERELRRPLPDAGRVNEHRQEMVRLRGDRERVLDAVMYHGLTFAHLADECAICDGSVSF